MKPYRITVADDDANMLFLLHKMLSRLFPNSSIASFSNAEDALSYILHIGSGMQNVAESVLGVGKGGYAAIREKARKHFVQEKQHVGVVVRYGNAVGLHGIISSQSAVLAKSWGEGEALLPGRRLPHTRAAYRQEQIYLRYGMDNSPAAKPARNTASTREGISTSSHSRDLGARCRDDTDAEDD